MKTNVLILVPLTVLLFACNRIGEDPQSSSSSEQLQNKASGGNAIAALVCQDGNNETHKGYIIETADKDTVLSFYIDVPNDVSGSEGGIWIFHPVIPIPYAFSVTILSPNDNRYIHYEIPAQNSMRPSDLNIDFNQIKQVLISPVE